MVPTTATVHRAQGTQSVQQTEASPPTPLQLNVTQVLSQDVVTADTIPVDTSSATPVGVFDNPNSGGVAGNTQAEALAVVALEGSAVQFAHIAPDSSSDGGWTMLTPFGSLAAAEVAAGVAYPDGSAATVYAFLFDGTTLHTAELQSDGVTWSSPQAVAGPAVSNLHTAYSPAGRLVLYGTDPDGNLATCCQNVPGGPFTTTVCSLPSSLAGDFQLVLTGESSWTMVANIGGEPMLVVGTLGSTEAGQSSLPSYSGTLQQVAVGFWNPAVNTAVFALVDTDDNLYLWSQTPSVAVVQTPSGAAPATASAVGHVSTDESLHIYIQDTSLNLWVLHQDPDMPWNDDGSPNWSPAIPLDTGIAGVASSGSPADAPTLFAIDAAIGSLRLHVQDPQTQMWRSGQVLTSSSQAYEVTRYRTEINVMDANGNPVPNHPVTLATAAGASACELSCAGSTVTVGSTPVNLTTDALGKVTLAMLTTAGLAAPQLSLVADGLPAPADVQPGSGVLTYLSGQGTLNPTNPGGPLPQFDAAGATLTAATVQGAPLAPGASGGNAGVAAAAIQNTAQTGLGTASSDMAGYQIQFGGPKPRFTTLRTPKELGAALDGAEGKADSFWGDIEKWAGDVWEGIKNGVIEIVGAIVEVATQIATFTVQIGDEIAAGVKLAVAGLEQAAHFISGVFAWVAAEVGKVIDWLKALFDFGAIWRTKMAFEQAVTQIPSLVTTFTQHYQSIANGWFTAQETKVTNAFTALANEATTAVPGGQFGNLSGYQQPPPDNSTPAVGGATPADFTQNVHHNWLQDKVSSKAPANPGVTPNDSPASLWQAFTDQLSASEGDFVAALENLAGSLQTLIENPDAFATQGIADLLTAIGDLVNTALSLADDVVETFLELVEAAMDGLSSLLTQELHWGPINTLWQWIADAAGYSDDGTLTVGALAALLGAFPTTVLYKLIEGVDTEPFPDGTFAPANDAMALGALDAAQQQSYNLAGSILQIVYVVPVLCGDVMGNDAPWWLTALRGIWICAIWALFNGLPIEEMLEGGAIALMALVLVLQIVPTALVQLLQDNYWNVTAVVYTLVGLAEYAIAGYVAADEPQDDYQLTADFLLPLASTFSFLNLSGIRDSAAGPYCTGAKCALNVVGYVGGGVAEAVWATEPSST